MHTETITIVATICFAILILALIIALIRLTIGPTLNDRVSALDLLAIIIMGFILVYAILIDKQIYMDVVIILSLVSFMSTIAVSHYIKNKKK